MKTASPVMQTEKVNNAKKQPINITIKYDFSTVIPSPYQTLVKNGYGSLEYEKTEFVW